MKQWLPQYEDETRTCQLRGFPFSAPQTDQLAIWGTFQCPLSLVTSEWVNIRVDGAPFGCDMTGAVYCHVGTFASTDDWKAFLPGDNLRIPQAI